MSKIYAHKLHLLSAITKHTAIAFLVLFTIFLPTKSSLAFQPTPPRILHSGMPYDQMLKAYNDAFIDSSFVLHEKLTIYVYFDKGTYTSEVARSSYLTYTFKDKRYPNHIAIANIFIDENPNEQQLCDPCTVFIVEQRINPDIAGPDPNKEVNKKADLDMYPELRERIGKAMKTAGEKLNR